MSPVFTSQMENDPSHLIFVDFSSWLANAELSAERKRDFLLGCASAYNECLCNFFAQMPTK